MLQEDFPCSGAKTRREKTLFLFADDSLERRRRMGTNIKLPGRGNGNFTFIAIGTIMNIMMINDLCV